MPPSSPLLVATLLLSGVLALSALAKVREPAASADAFVALRLPRLLLRARVPRLLPWGELALALGLLLAPATLRLPLAAAGVLLMGAYAAVIGRALTFSEPVTCHCFGKLAVGTVSRRTLVRNLVLVLIGVLALVDAGRAEGSVIADLGGLGGRGWGWLAMCALTGILTWLILDRGPHNSRPGSPQQAPHRATDHRATDRAADPARDPDAAADTDEAEPEYARTLIPYGMLEDPQGRLHSMRDLARTRARLLVFLNLNCGSCISLRAELPAFAEANPEVAVHPVYHSGVEVAAIPEGLDWLLDPDGGVSRTFDFFVTPSAILLGTDGLLAGGPVEGADNVLDLLAGVSEELAAVRA